LKTEFSNIEVVTIAVYLLGGDSAYVDTEDVAIKANELAPGRFTWRKYPDQINIEKVRISLSDAKKLNKGAYLFGFHREGWILTENGLEFSLKRIDDLKNTDLSRRAFSTKERAWLYREKARMLSTVAYEKANSKNVDDLIIPEIEAFFRLDEYVTGRARELKIARIMTAFANDPELGDIVRTLARRVRKNDREQ